MLESLQQLDQEVFLFLNGLRSPFLDHFMWLFTGKIIWVPMYVAILYVLCRNFNRRLTLFTVIAIALLITYADQVCSGLIRPWVERMRPSNPDNPLSEFVHILHGKRGGRYGFPSCHASNSFALAFFLTFFFRQKSLSIFILCWATVNSYSRIYIGVHYPGDLLAGSVVGLSGALLVCCLYRYLLRQAVLRDCLADAKSLARLSGTEKFRAVSWISGIGLGIIAAIALYSLFAASV